MLCRFLTRLDFCPIFAPSIGYDGPEIPPLPQLTRSVPKGADAGHAPEQFYLQARWSSIVPYAALAELLTDVLPIVSGPNRTT